jgi:hypothetical protein
MVERYAASRPEGDTGSCPRDKRAIDRAADRRATRHAPILAHGKFWTRCSRRTSSGGTGAAHKARGLKIPWALVGSGRAFAAWRYMVGGKINNNNRLYETQHLLDLVSDLQPTIKEGGLVGELGHNNNSQTPDYNRVSHVVKSLRHKGNGEFWGRSELLKEGAGKVLQSCIDAGARIGISTKGTGDVRKMKTESGQQYDLVLPESYKLISFDAVHSPSAPGAFVKALKEQVMNKKLSLTENALALDILRRIPNIGASLANQQERMEYSVADNLYAGHSGYPSLENFRVATMTALERSDEDTLRVIAKLLELQGFMADVDASHSDSEGVATIRHRYASAIKDPIARAQENQRLWNVRTNEIMRNRAVQQLARLGKFNKGGYENARRGWDTGVTSEMRYATSEVIDTFERVLVYLAAWYPPKHFNGQDPAQYFSDFIASRYQWHRALHEQTGPGSGGTLAGVLAGGDTLEDVSTGVVDMVEARSTISW